MSTRRVFLSGAVATAVGAALAACAKQDLPTPSVTATPSAHPALTADKLTAILWRRVSSAKAVPFSPVGLLRASI